MINHNTTALGYRRNFARTSDRCTISSAPFQISRNAVPAPIGHYGLARTFIAPAVPVRSVFVTVLCLFGLVA